MSENGYSEALAGERSQGEVNQPGGGGGGVDFSPGEINLKSEIFGIGLFSFVVMVQASHVCKVVNDNNGDCDGNTVYAIIASLLSLLFCAALIVTKKGDALPMPARAAFAVFWLIAACVCTFDPPFQTLGNGYFAAWTCAILAIQWLAADPVVQAQLTEASSAPLKEKAIALLVAASLVELIAACVACDTNGIDCTQYYGFAVALGVISLVVSIAWLVLANKITGNPAKALSAVMCLLWLVGAFAFTIKEPFRAAGNGYFASWIAFLCTFYLCFEICIKENTEAPPTAVDV